MARKTKATAAPLRRKLALAAAKRPAPRRVDIKSVTLERLRIGTIMGRLEKQALGELSSRRKQGMDSAMTLAQQDAAKFLVSLVIPKAEAPKQLDLGGNITVVMRDPRDRPPGYKRKGRASLNPTP